jgi:hypothetical protein
MMTLLILYDITGVKYTSVQRRYQLMSKSEEYISMFRLRSIQLNNTAADEAPGSSSST